MPAILLTNSILRFSLFFLLLLLRSSPVSRISTHLRSHSGVYKEQFIRGEVTYSQNNYYTAIVSLNFLRYIVIMCTYTYHVQSNNNKDFY